MKTYQPLLALSLLLVAALVTGVALGLPFIGPEGGRRLLVMHATLSGLLLPLAIAAVFALEATRAQAGSPHRPWVGAALQGGFFGVVVLLGGIAALSPGKPLRTTFLPSIDEPAFALLLILVALLVLAVLLRRLLRKPADPATAGLAWCAVPLVVTLVSLAWAWTAADAQAGHVRVELATWAAGHAVFFFIVSLLLWVWLRLAEINGVQRSRWCIAAALPALSVLIAQALLSIDDAAYLRVFPELLRWGIWPVPLLLAGAILRDEIRRAVGGWPLAGSMLLFTLVPVASFVLAADPGGQAGFALVLLNHALPLALIVASGSLLLRGQVMGARAKVTAPARREWPRALGGVVAIGVLVVLVATLTLPPRPPVLPDRLPQGDTPRQHVDAKRDEEIAQRFAQGVEMMRRKQFDFAAKAFHRVLELDPTLPEAHVNMGFALLESGDPAGAQRFFESATQLRAEQLNAYYGLALAALAQNNFEVAVGALRTWLHLAPADDPFRPQAEARFDAMQKAFMEQRAAARR